MLLASFRKWLTIREEVFTKIHLSRSILIVATNCVSSICMVVLYGHAFHSKIRFALVNAYKKLIVARLIRKRIG